MLPLLSSFLVVATLAMCPANEMLRLCEVSQNYFESVSKIMSLPNGKLCSKYGLVGKVNETEVRRPHWDHWLKVVSNQLFNPNCWGGDMFSANKCPRTVVHEVLKKLKILDRRLAFAYAKFLEFDPVARFLFPWRHIWQTPVYFYPELETLGRSVWYDEVSHTHTPLLNALRDSFVAAKEELAQYLQRTPLTTSWGAAEERAGWYQYWFHGAGHWNEETCRDIAPTLCRRFRALVPTVRHPMKLVENHQESLEVFGLVPGGYVTLHSDATNARVTTLMCLSGCEGCWLSVAGHRKSLEEGKLISWDAGYDHWTGNNGNSIRWVISLAFSHPSYASHYQTLQPGPRFDINTVKQTDRMHLPPVSTICEDVDQSDCRRLAKSECTQSPGLMHRACGRSCGVCIIPGTPNLPTMPMIGFGTCCRESSRGDALKESMRNFLRFGGRLIDTAMVYENHREIGEVLKEPAFAWLRREDVFITSKVLPEYFGLEETSKALEGILRELQTDYLDLVLLHWGVDRRKNIEAWLAFEAAFRSGTARAIGVSNFVGSQIDELMLDGATIRPMNNQIDLHPGKPQREVVRYCAEHGISVTAFNSVKGKASLPGGDLALQSIGQRRGMTDVQVLLRWALDQGIAVIPGCTSSEHIKEALDVANRGPLEGKDFDELEAG